jgi:hypothetical protein
MQSFTMRRRTWKEFNCQELKCFLVDWYNLRGRTSGYCVWLSPLCRRLITPFLVVWLKFHLSGIWEEHAFSLTIPSIHSFPSLSRLRLSIGDSNVKHSTIITIYLYESYKNSIYIHSLYYNKIFLYIAIYESLRNLRIIASWASPLVNFLALVQFFGPVFLDTFPINRTIKWEK